ncbi:MAG: M28 family peptidase [Verrucomicrobiae bacterium]|nr:M28 family peptidase [Verrucomicrobiae bacterium]
MPCKIQAGWIFCLWPFFVLHAQKGPLADQFDAARAFAHVEKQVSFGPRPPGSTGIQLARQYLSEELRRHGIKTREQSFQANTPTGPIQFTNLMATLPGKSSLFARPHPLIILGSHYDTKWFPKQRFVGANDSASSTATLLEIGRILSLNPQALGSTDVTLMFFDGEEAFREYDAADGLYGSRHCAANLGRDTSRAKAMILLDMIGDRDLNVEISRGEPGLAAKVLEAARLAGCRDLFSLMDHELLDDHVPFKQRGIPSICLIDFQYGPQNRWWHTPDDSMDKISAESLRAIGKTTLHLLELLAK